MKVLFVLPWIQTRLKGETSHLRKWAKKAFYLSPLPSQPRGLEIESMSVIPTNAMDETAGETPVSKA
jgi:hypothetical protein